MEVSSLPRPGSGLLPRSRRVLGALGDDRLVEQIRRGNDTAFEVAYDRHHRAILSFCRHMLSSREEAEDATQHTFISAYNDLVGSEKEIKLKPWLYAIARNRCLSILRARREEAAELADIPTAGLSESAQEREDLRRMLADMAQLPEEQRSALVLSELGDLSHSEIAGVVGCETLKVKSLVFQARSSLLESRQARETPCDEIREQLSTLRGGALRRGPLRKHLHACPGCQEFREEVRRQRAAMAALLPVVPSATMKSGVMAAIGLGGGGAAGGGAIGLGGAGLVGGGAAAGGSAGLGSVASFIAAAGVTKVAVAAVVATGTVAGGAVVVDEVTGGGGNAAVAQMPERSPDDGVAMNAGLASGGTVDTPAGKVVTVKSGPLDKESPKGGAFLGEQAREANPADADEAAHARNEARRAERSKGSKGGSRRGGAPGFSKGGPGGGSSNAGGNRGGGGKGGGNGGNANGGPSGTAPARPPRSQGNPQPGPATPAAPGPTTSDGPKTKSPKETKPDRGAVPGLPNPALPKP